MIDLHTHILPNLDDGARNIPESLKIIKKEITAGVTTIVATPNFIPGLYEPTPTDITHSIAVLKKALDELRWPVNILPGMEVRLSPKLFSMCTFEQFQTINDTQYILVDIFQTPFTRIEMVLENIINHKLIPILGHPEKCADVQKDIKLLEPWIEKGLLIQVSTGSLAGMYGGRVKKTAEKLLQKNLVHILATDAHDFARNLVSLDTGVKIAEVFIGERAQLLASKNCDMILKGKLLSL
jgi:protein-tyrosine phosphatase